MLLEIQEKILKSLVKSNAVPQIYLNQSLYYEFIYNKEILVISFNQIDKKIYVYYRSKNDPVTFLDFIRDLSFIKLKNVLVCDMKDKGSEEISVIFSEVIFRLESFLDSLSERKLQKVQSDFFEGNNYISFSITKKIMGFLDENHIFCHEQKNNEPRRWKIGDRLTVLKETVLEPYVCYRAGNNLSALGAFSYTGSSLPLNMQVGRYCSIAHDVKVMGWQHPVSAVTTNVMVCVPSIKWVKKAHENLLINNFSFVDTPQKSGVKIGHDVWIGQNVLLATGITIGTGAIIAAGSVVTEDVEPYAIVGGNKAELIRYRFTKKIRDLLLESKWWEYNFYDMQNLDFSDPIIFLEQFLNIKDNLLPWRPEPISIYDFIKNQN